MPEPPEKPDRAYASAIADVSFQPVFIMGNARSGTTLLYQLLSMTGRFNRVTAYHVLCFDELLSHHFEKTSEIAKRELSDRLSRIGAGDSRFDGVEISPDFPEEYGFLLSRRYPVPLGPKNLARFIETCRTVQLVSETDRPLLLKNPWDYNNFVYVKKVFPNSRFIFIHRNPIHVVNSLLKGMRSLLRVKNPYHALLASSYDRLMETRLRRAFFRTLFTPSFDLGVRVVTRHVVRTAEYFLANVGSLEAGDYVRVRYEDFCESPREVLERILSFLGQRPPPELDYDSLVKKREPELAEEVVRRKALIVARLERYLASCGYRVADDSGRLRVA